MTDKIITFIQKEFNNSIKRKFSRKYIENNVFPIIKYIVSTKNKKFLLAGSQGIGKSSLIQIIEKTLRNYYKLEVLSLSLDNYYMTKKERINISKKIDPLLITRGVPGTHNIKILLENIKSFETSKYPIIIPVFDKLKDDQSKIKKKIIKKSDILILEGWCCGSPPLTKKYLRKDINIIEKMRDKKYIWRDYYNNKLKGEYAKLFNSFNRTIFLKAHSFTHIYNWRIKQEKMMALNKREGESMNKKDIIYFISHFEKITKWMSKTLPLNADLVINIDKDQKIKKIKYN